MAWSRGLPPLDINRIAIGDSTDSINDIYAIAVSQILELKKKPTEPPPEININAQAFSTLKINAPLKIKGIPTCGKSKY